MDYPDWTREYFERGYAQRWGLPAPSDRVREEVRALCRLLQLSSTSRVSVNGSRGHEEYERRQRLYRAEELRAALEHAGFAVVALLGDPDGRPFEPTVSSTIWIVGQRGVSRLDIELDREIDQHDR